MRYLPMFRKIHRQRCLVVGAGDVAFRKVTMLLRAGADVTMVAPRVSPAVRDLSDAGKITLNQRRFVPTDISDQALIVSATGIHAIDELVAAEGKRASIAVNVVDNPTLSDFIFPAIVDRDPMIVAVSTGGAAPVLAREIRSAIEALLPTSLGALIRKAEKLRATAKRRLGSVEERRRFWTQYFQGWRTATLTGDKLPRHQDSAILFENAKAKQIGHVALVGAGPGDADLLTLRALQHLQDADVIIHDRLIGPDVLDYARRDAERIDVGKAPGKHSHNQTEINALLAHHASLGKQVVRLKGGDPFIFGRGGEELEYLQALNISVEVVPGVTASLGCAASAGIPLTHRDATQAVTLLTGTSANELAAQDWPALVANKATLAVYMGLATADRLREELISAGIHRDMPVAVIENGTLATERVVTGQLGNLDALIKDNAIRSPAMLIIGEVVEKATSAKRVTNPTRNSNQLREPLILAAVS
jgi:uroporphyrin-III C-methyltransferase/precorrin-2 dehydrogenase/sirohydrochlorin ferrochelatase